MDNFPTASAPTEGPAELADAAQGEAGPSGGQLDAAEEGSEDGDGSDGASDVSVEVDNV